MTLKLLAELIVPVVNPGAGARATDREDVEPIREWQPQESGAGIQLHRQTAGRHGIYVHHSGESPVGPCGGQHVPGRRGLVRFFFSFFSGPAQLREVGLWPVVKCFSSG